MRHLKNDMSVKLLILRKAIEHILFAGKQFNIMLLFSCEKKTFNFKLPFFVQQLTDQFCYIKIQPKSKTIDLKTRPWGITTEFVGLIPQSLGPRSIVLG